VGVAQYGLVTQMFSLMHLGLAILFASHLLGEPVYITHANPSQTQRAQTQFSEGNRHQRE
jgi:hypothetical protein